MREGEGHSAKGKSIIEMLWEQADIMYAQLMDVEQAWAVEDIAELIAGDPDDVDGISDDAANIAEYWELRGKLGGLTYALYRMLHTYDKPKIGMDKIKAELRERWEAEQEEDDEEE